MSRLHEICGRLFGACLFPFSQSTVRVRFPIRYPRLRVPLRFWRSRISLGRRMISIRVCPLYVTALVTFALIYTGLYFYDSGSSNWMDGSISGLVAVTSLGLIAHMHFDRGIFKWTPASIALMYLFLLALAVFSWLFVQWTFGAFSPGVSEGWFDVGRAAGIISSIGNLIILALVHGSQREEVKEEPEEMIAPVAAVPYEGPERRSGEDRRSYAVE
jgi:hypothetical protein